MLDEMAGETFIGWRRYYNVEPWGEERADMRSALLGLAICSCLGAKNLKLEAFLPVRDEAEDEKPQEQTPEQRVNIVHMIVAMQQGKAQRK